MTEKTPRMYMTQCPFFVKLDKGQKIICEGWAPNTMTVTRFKSLSDFTKQRKARCNNTPGFKACPLYNLIMDEMYEGGDEC